MRDHISALRSAAIQALGGEEEVEDKDTIDASSGKRERVKGGGISIEILTPRKQGEEGGIE